MTTAAIFIVFFAVVALNVWSMWRRNEITGVGPTTPRERRRLVWVAVGAVNFILFVLHAAAKGACAFPTGGNLVDGVYLVPSHGNMIPFSPTAYALSYTHGVVAVTTHLACMIAVWRLLQSRENGKPKPSLGANSKTTGPDSREKLGTEVCAGHDTCGVRDRIGTYGQTNLP